MSAEKLTKAERKALRKQEREQEEIIRSSRRRFWRNMMVVFAIIVFALTVYLVNFFLRSDVTGAASDINDPIKGSPNAGVIIRAYSDFQCPACQQAALGVNEALKSYDADEVALIFNDYPLVEIHPKSYEAALAGQCANEQGKFWEMHDRIFLDQQTWSSLEDPMEKFVAYARVFEMDEDAFRACVAEERYKSLIQEDIAEGISLNIDATPTYFINSTRVVGVKSVDDLEEIINRALGK